MLLAFHLREQPYHIGLKKQTKFMIELKTSEPESDLDFKSFVKTCMHDV